MLERTPPGEALGRAVAFRNKQASNRHHFVLYAWQEGDGSGRPTKVPTTPTIAPPFWKASAASAYGKQRRRSRGKGLA